MRTVLLIDDSKILINLLTKVLSENFKIVGTAHDGEEGFEKYRTLRPDIVLLDITMPNCGGLECLKLIIEENKNAEVYMCSSRGDEKTVAECISLGAKGFIHKDQLSINSKESQKLLFETIPLKAA